MPKNQIYPPSVRRAQRISYLIHQANNGGLLPDWSELSEEARSQWEATILVAVATYARDAANEMEKMSTAFAASLDGFLATTEAMRQRINDLQVDLRAATGGDEHGQ